MVYLDSGTVRLACPRALTFDSIPAGSGLTTLVSELASRLSDAEAATSITRRLRGADGNDVARVLSPFWTL